MLQALASELIFRRNDIEARTKEMFEQYEQRLTLDSYETGLEQAQGPGGNAPTCSAIAMCCASRPRLEKRRKA